MYEYKAVVDNHNCELSEVNKLAAKGWELYKVVQLVGYDYYDRTSVPITNTNIPAVMFIMRRHCRELEPEPARVTERRPIGIAMV